MSPLLLVILGPTACGKTRLAIEAAKRYNVPVINADSRQIFRSMTIGTAAPTRQEQAEARHYMVGSLDIDSYYNAAMYESDVIKLIGSLAKEAAAAGRTVRPTAILAGGSMMYIDAVCQGIDDIPTIADDIRSAYKRRLAEEGLDPLLEELSQVDPEHYAIVDRHNPRRVVHALEICRQTGRTYTSFRRRAAKERPFDVIKVGVEMARELLYERINRRVEQMIAAGLEQEARSLIGHRHCQALNTVGYKEMFDYIDGKYSLAEAVQRIQGNTRRYARKQLTWFKRDPNIVWSTPEEFARTLDTVISQNSIYD